ncbi:secreted protein [methanotrophic bacterial endosymbiont of Bathymodiolus sp.]|nr:secreted protein [methanotrophic bacterial endosymbiont of Bathymodiolus sp.]
MGLSGVLLNYANLRFLKPRPASPIPNRAKVAGSGTLLMSTPSFSSTASSNSSLARLAD